MAPGHELLTSPTITLGGSRMTSTLNAPVTVLVPAYALAAEARKNAVSRRNHGFIVSILLIITSLVGLGMVDAFRHNHQYLLARWVGLVSEHPRVTADACACFFFMLLTAALIMLSILTWRDYRD